MTESANSIWQDMSGRMHSISLYGEFFSLLHTKSMSLQKKGLESIDQQITFIFYVLRYVMEKTLSDEECSLQDIGNAIEQIGAQYFNLFWSEEEALSLADMIIHQLLCNAGEPIIFDPFNESPIYLNFITSSVLYNEQGRVVGYKMSDDGFRLMLSTMEMEQNMTLAFRDLVFRMQLEKRNYPKALDELRQIFQLLRIRQIEIQEKSVQVKNNVISVSSKEYKSLYEDNFAEMAQARSKFEEYQKTVEHAKEELSEKNNGSLDEQEKSNYATLSKISSLLHQSILALSSILSSLNEFSVLYGKQIQEQMRAGSFRRHSIKTMVYERVLASPDLLEKMDIFLHPLFFKDPQKQMQLSHAFEYKRLSLRQEDGTLEELDEDYDEQYEMQKQQAKQARLQAYDASLRIVLEALLQNEDHFLSLKELCQDAKTSKEIFPNEAHAKQLLVSWQALGTIDLKELYEMEEDLYLDEQDGYNFSLSLLEASHTLKELKDKQTLQFEKGKERLSLTFETEDGFFIQLNCSDLVLSLQ
jgi:hypothetical protein